MKLEDLEVYKLSMDLGERVWSFVKKWDYFAKDTIGKQLLKAVDSVAANLSEGFGRFHYREKKHFSYYSRGSLYETRTWLTKAHNRNLLNHDDYDYFMKNIDFIGVKLNNYIRATGSKEVHDDPEDYN
ncbi:MAG TPA: four helix bundle protein [Bacteroidetes bacterium]|nr:four helix bundle protein [Bacteroidota bacterium]